MFYKTIIACLDNSSSARNTIESSMDFALENDGHLSCMHITYLPTFFYDAFGDVAPRLIEWESWQEKTKNEISATLRSLAKSKGLNADWSEYQSTETQTVAIYARTSDLVVISQSRTDEDYFQQRQRFITNLVLQAGKPILLLPENPTPLKEYSNIVVAWNGSRESARATADAMPFLMQAKEVKVISIKEMDFEFDLPDLDIVNYLSRHTVKAEIAEETDTSMETAELLIEKLEDFNADLLVMGGYGHSRISEVILGGITKNIFKKMPLPFAILMSH